MSWLKAMKVRTTGVVRRKDADARMDEEIRFHIEMETEANLRAGMSPREARRRALVAFGGVERHREVMREGRRLGWLEDAFRDTHLALRTLRRSPGFVAVSILSLALGLGLNTALFGIVHSVVLRPLPVKEPEWLVSVFHRHQQGYMSSNSYQDYLFYREHSHLFSAAAVFMGSPLFLGTDDAPERVSGELVSPGYFQLLGLDPVLGRTFRPTPGVGGVEADEEGAVVILAHGYWLRRFGGDPDVIGRTVSLGGHPFTVVGVAPKGFRGLTPDVGSPPEVWVPTAAYREAVPSMAPFDLHGSWGAHTFMLVARLAPEISMEEARTAMEVVGARAGALRQEAWEDGGRYEPVLLPVQEARIWPELRQALQLFMVLLVGISGLVLLLACFNVANLMVARAVKRRREVAVRLSLGAGKGRIARQLLAESLLLSLAGGGLGLLVAWGAGAYLAGLHNPFGITVNDLRILETGVLGFVLLASLATGTLVGLLPLRQASKVDISSAMKGEIPRASGAGRISSRDLLVAAQVTLCFLFLVGSGLFLRTLSNAQSEDVVAQPENVLLVTPSLQAAGFDPGRSREILAELVERAGSFPGVLSASLVHIVPMGGRRGARDISAETPASPGQPERLNMEFNVVSPHYFLTQGLPIVRGRPFSELDREGSPMVAMVNESMAQRLWPGQDPLGRTFQVHGHGEGPVEVVGVVADSKFRNYRAPVAPGFFLPFAQSSVAEMSLLVRADGNPMALAPLLRGALREMDGTIPQPELMTMKAYRNMNLFLERLVAQLFSAFGLLALILAVLGVYGVISFAVAQRTREIGIRMALGARAGAITALVLWRGVLLALAGLVLGGAAALVLTRFVGALLYGVEPGDPATFAAVALTLLGAALLASWIPARRAAAADPSLSLRIE
jgi:predicted permease